MSCMFCTAAPDAPLPRLSSRATSTAWPRLLVGEHAELEQVGAVERLGLEIGRRRPRGSTRTNVAARVTRGQRVVQRRRQSALPFSRSRCSGTETSMPWRKCPTDGHEDRPAREPAVALDFRHVLVLEAERVEVEGAGRRSRSCASIIALPPPE